MRTIDFSLIELIPSDKSYREFSYQVKKEAEGDYITEIWGWDEKIQRDFHTDDWNKRRPKIITYDGKPIGTICIMEYDEYIDVKQFFIMPEYQNKGIGSYLLKGVLDTADRTSRITKLAFLQINPVASLYKRNNFVTVDVKNHFCFMERKPRRYVSEEQEPSYEV